jgi:hypothetical protein
MIDGKMVVMFTFVGRQRFMEPLFWHSLRARPFVDKHALCIHTGNPRDLDYINAMVAKHPDYFYKVDIGFRPGEPRYSQFFSFFTDPNTWYIKCDDDVIWLEDGAIERLVRYKRDRPELLMAFSNTVNNGLCNHLHQRFGAARSPIHMPWDAHFVNTGTTPELIRHCADVHNSFLENLRAGKLGLYTSFEEFLLWEKNIRFSINCLCMAGPDIRLMLPVFDEDRRVRNVLSADDERLMTEVMPGLFGRENAICGRSLVAHFSFGAQQEYLLRTTDVLDRYRGLAGLGTWRTVAN